MEIMKNMYIGNGIQTTADLRRVISDALQFVPESNREYEIKKSSLLARISERINHK